MSILFSELSHFLLPDVALVCCLYVVIAVRKTAFHVIYFKVARFKGSKGGLRSNVKTFGKSHSWTNFIVGGFDLNTPFNNLIIYGCCPTGILFTVGKIEDSIERYPAMVLTCKPLLNRSAKNPKH